MKSIAVGLQKTSLVDYPGRVASVFFLAGCNFACPYCHNPELVHPKPESGSSQGFVPLPVAMDHLKRRKDLLSGVVLSGGEPCLYPELPDLAADIRQLGLLVKLDTNGSLPDRILPVQADYIAMDLKTDPERYGILWPSAPADAAGRIRASMETVRSSGSAYEFRITCAPGIFGPAEAEALALLLRPEDTVILQNYRPGRVLDPAWAARVRPYVDSELDGLLGNYSKPGAFGQDTGERGQTPRRGIKMVLILSIPMISTSVLSGFSVFCISMGMYSNKKGNIRPLLLLILATCVKVETGTLDTLTARPITNKIHDIIHCQEFWQEKSA